MIHCSCPGPLVLLAIPNARAQPSSRAGREGFLAQLLPGAETSLLPQTSPEHTRATYRPTLPPPSGERALEERNFPQRPKVGGPATNRRCVGRAGRQSPEVPGGHSVRKKSGASPAGEGRPRATRWRRAARCLGKGWGVRAGRASCPGIWRPAPAPAPRAEPSRGQSAGAPRPARPVPLW